MPTNDFGAMVKEFCDSRSIPISDGDAATLGLWFKVALPGYFERLAESASQRGDRRLRRDFRELEKERDQLLRDVESLTDRLAAQAPPPTRESTTHLVDRIHAILVEAGPDGVKKSEIRDRLGSHAWKSDRITPALVILRMEGRAVEEQAPGGRPGRTPTIWRASSPKPMNADPVLRRALTLTSGDPSRSLRVLRTHAGWTQADLASVAGVSRETVSRIEKGVGSPSLGTAKKLADALNCEVSDLLPVKAAA